MESKNYIEFVFNHDEPGQESTIYLVMDGFKYRVEVNPKDEYVSDICEKISQYMIDGIVPDGYRFINANVAYKPKVVNCTNSISIFDTKDYLEYTQELKELIEGRQVKQLEVLYKLEHAYDVIDARLNKRYTQFDWRNKTEGQIEEEVAFALLTIQEALGI